MAIAEYVAEQCPGRAVWPAARADRAMARSVSAEMHAGFAALREELPMDIMGRHAKVPSASAQADIDRIQEIWRSCRQGHGDGGPFLFGPFSAADAMYAPVVTRFVTYGIAVDDMARDYMKSVLAHPAMAEWCRAAAAEVEAWGPTL
jgi:glutathione S-transferase